MRYQNEPGKYHKELEGRFPDFPTEYGKRKKTSDDLSGQRGNDAEAVRGIGELSDL